MRRAEAAGLGDDDAAVGGAALEDAPGDAGGEFAGELDAGGVEGAEDEGCGFAAGEDERGSGSGGEGGADRLWRGRGPVDAMDACPAMVSFEMGDLQRGDRVVGSDEEEGAARPALGVGGSGWCEMREEWRRERGRARLSRSRGWAVECGMRRRRGVRGRPGSGRRRGGCGCRARGCRRFAAPVGGADGEDVDLGCSRCWGRDRAG